MMASQCSWQPQITMFMFWMHTQEKRLVCLVETILGYEIAVVCICLWSLPDFVWSDCFSLGMTCITVGETFPMKRCGFSMEPSPNTNIEATFTPDGQYVVSGNFQQLSIEIGLSFQFLSPNSIVIFVVKILLVNQHKWLIKLVFSIYDLFFATFPPQFKPTSSYHLYAF